jgi:hypothetical protein
MLHDVFSVTDTRWSRITPSQGGYMLRYGTRSSCPDTGSAVTMCFFFDEREAHRAARWWERDAVEPQSSPTLVGLQPALSPEQLEAWRFDVAARRLEVRP